MRDAIRRCFGIDDTGHSAESASQNRRCPATIQSIGKDRHSRVDADTYVDIFQELIQDDDGMYEILKSTSAGEQLAEHMKAKEGKKIANKILSAAPVRLS